MKHKSEDYKIAAVRPYLNQSQNRDDTARTFSCPKRSLTRWRARFRDTQSIRRHNRIPVAYKVTQEQAAWAVNHVRSHQTISSPELQTAAQNRFPGIDISTRRLFRVVRQNNLTRKRTRHGHFPRERYRQPVDRSEQLRAFYRITDAHPIDRIISIDETSLTPFMYRAYSRCDLGDRCIQVTDNNRVFTKHTFVCAITDARLLGWEMYDEGAMTAERMVTFLTRLIRENRLRGYLFVMDNAGAHKGQSIRGLIANSGNQLAYSVPYNPQTNVIEGWFSQFKYHMSTAQTRDIEGIRTDIRRVIELIQPRQYREYFRYSYRRQEYPDRPRPLGSTLRMSPRRYKPI